MTFNEITISIKVNVFQCEVQAMDLSLEVISQEKPTKGLEPYIEEFHEDRIKDLKEMSSMLWVNDFESIRKHAHKWKSFSRPYGFIFLEEVALLIEKAAKKNSPSELKEQLSMASKYLDLKIKALKQ